MGSISSQAGSVPACSVTRTPTATWSTPPALLRDMDAFSDAHTGQATPGGQKCRQAWCSGDMCVCASVHTDVGAHEAGVCIHVHKCVCVPCARTCRHILAGAAVHWLCPRVGVNVHVCAGVFMYTRTCSCSFQGKQGGPFLTPILKQGLAAPVKCLFVKT